MHRRPNKLNSPRRERRSINLIGGGRHERTSEGRAARGGSRTSLDNAVVAREKLQERGDAWPRLAAQSSDISTSTTALAAPWDDIYKKVKTRTTVAS